MTRAVVRLRSDDVGQGPFERVVQVAMDPRLDAARALPLALVELLDDLAEGQDEEPDVVDLADEDALAGRRARRRSGRSSAIVAIVR